MLPVAIGGPIALQFAVKPDTLLIFWAYRVLRAFSVGPPSLLGCRPAADAKSKHTLQYPLHFCANKKGLPGERQACFDSS
jgi:hypothetical protein